MSKRFPGDGMDVPKPNRTFSGALVAGGAAVGAVAALLPWMSFQGYLTWGTVQNTVCLLFLLPLIGLGCWMLGGGASREDLFQLQGVLVMVGSLLAAGWSVLELVAGAVAAQQSGIVMQVQAGPYLMTVGLGLAFTGGLLPLLQAPAGAVRPAPSS